MWESGKTIIPVFYGVNPSELRWTRGGDGVYAKALCSLEQKTTIDPITKKEEPRHDSDTIEKWRSTLSNVSKISGFELSACNGDEGQLVDKVVQRVLKKVYRAPLKVAQYPTGLEDKVEDVERTVLSQEGSGKVRVVGIVGLPGVGKTTLAKEFFNCHRPSYGSSCFVSDVRGDAVNSSVNYLKRHFSSSHQALIVLDGVDHIDQLSALFASVEDTIRPGSLMLITSSNKHVLTNSDIQESSIYTLTGLDRQHSQELFCSHAFGQPYPDIRFEQLVGKYLDACDGFPLSLKVLGVHLRGVKDLPYWEGQLRKISKILPRDVVSKLKIIYDDLDLEEKQIFLDIACFFIGEDRDTAIRIWNASNWQGWVGFCNLENRCLVEVDGKNCIRMQDHLRDLGRDLAEKEHPGFPHRLRCPTENFLHNMSGQSLVVGISRVHGEGTEQSFENLAKLAGGLLLTTLNSSQLFLAEGNFIHREFNVGQLPQLIWLWWENSPYSPFPIPIKILRVLYIKGRKLETLWQHEESQVVKLREESQALVQSRELTTHSPLLKVAKSVGKLLTLKTPLLKLAKSIGKLKQRALQQRELTTNYSPLFKLPKSTATLKHLEKLVLQRILFRDDRRTLPNEFCDMHSLKHLELNCCENMTSLPHSFGILTNLQKISFGGCTSLQRLPDSIGNLENLESLDLGRCSSLQMLPDSVGSMVNLQSLELGRCFGLQMLPDSIGNLENLESLDLGQCSSLQMLPESVGRLVNLQSLELGRCFGLQLLPDSFGRLVNLQSLDLGQCSSLQILPDAVGNMVNLQSLDLGQCSSLQMLPYTVGNMVNLQSLDLGGCSFLWTLPDSVEHMRNLQSLDLSACFALKALPHSIRMLTNLKELTITEMTNLDLLDEEECISREPTSKRPIALRSKLEGVFPYLEHLKIYHYRLEKARALPSTLLELELSYCPGLWEIRELCDLPYLQILTITHCNEVVELPSIETLISLKELEIYVCVKLKHIVGLAQLNKLRILRVCDCSELEALPGVEHLRSLGELSASRCPKLQWGWGVVEQLRERLKRSLI